MIQHLDQVSSNALMIYDRGYLALRFMQAHLEQSMDFCMRCLWNLYPETRDFYLSDQREILLNVRLVRVDLPNDEKEILITSVFRYEVSLLEQPPYATSP